jgi:ankyrin repeat protein
MGAEIDPRTEFGGTPLYLACSAGAADIIAFLLSRGASVHARTVFGITILMSTMLARNLACVNLVLEAGADVNHRGSMDPKCPDPSSILIANGCALHIAADKHIIQRLLEVGADPRFQVRLRTKRETKKKNSQDGDTQHVVL